MTIFKYALKRGFTPVSAIINFGLPLFFMIVMRGEGVGVQTVMGDQSLYLIAFVVMVGGYFMAKGIQNDRMEGVLLRILSGPTTMRDYLTQNLLAATVPMIGVSIWISALGIFLHDWDMTFAVGMALIYTFLAITSIGLSFAWSSLFKSKEASSGAFGAVLTAMSLLSGFFVPLNLMPDFLFYLGAIFPAHWASRAIIIMVDYGQFTQMFWLSLLAMFLFTVAFVLFGGKRRLI